MVFFFFLILRTNWSSKTFFKCIFKIISGGEKWNVWLQTFLSNGFISYFTLCMISTCPCGVIDGIKSLWWCHQLNLLFYIYIYMIGLDHRAADWHQDLIASCHIWQNKIGMPLNNSVSYSGDMKERKYMMIK